jgi:hypothetical protein
MLLWGDVGCVQTSDGATPLWIACQNGHQAMAGLLLDRGADVNQARVCYSGGEGACEVLDGMWVLIVAGASGMGCDECVGGWCVCRLWCA